MIGCLAGVRARGSVLIGVVCGILIGGKGTRIGGDKAAKELANKPLLSWVIDAVTPQADAIALCGGPLSIPIYEHYLQLPDAPGMVGPASGLVAALAWAEAQNSKDLMVVPCDMPFLPLDLASLLRAQAPAYVCIDQQPIWTVSYWPAATLSSSLQAIRALEDKAPPLRACMKSVGAQAAVAPQSAQFMGVNTHEELEDAQVRALSGQ